MVDRNSFISKFFFNKLLIPFLSTNYLFSHISKNTISNLKFICSILQKYISGNLFCSDDSEYSFTPFNWCIIYNIKYSFPLFESLTKVNLSSHQENLINNKLPLDYEYEYFKENPDKDAYISSIIININQIKALIVTIDSNKKKLLFTDNNINSIKRATEKLMVGHNKELIENIINQEKEEYNKYKERKNNQKGKIKEEEKPKIKYFLLSNIYVNEKYEIYSKISSKNFNLYIDPKKESKEENDIIKSKNYLNLLLKEYKRLEKSDF